MENSIMEENQLVFTIDEVAEFVKELPEYFSIKGQHFRLLVNFSEVKKGYLIIHICPHYINGDSTTHYLGTLNATIRISPVTIPNIFQLFTLELMNLNLYDLINKD